MRTVLGGNNRIFEDKEEWKKEENSGTGPQLVKDVAEDGDSQWDPVLPRGIRCLLGSFYTKCSVLYRVFCDFLFSCISWNSFSTNT